MLTKNWRETARDSIAPGLAAAAAVSTMAAVCGKREADSSIAPVNATSHILWGDNAARVNQPTVRYTLVGFFINAGAAIFWGAVFEKLFGRWVERHGLSAAAAASVTTAGVAYVTDYHLVPRRLTPGYEKHVSRQSLLLIYGALALGLGAGSLWRHRTRNRTGET